MRWSDSMFASTPSAAQVMATRSASPASWNSGGVARVVDHHGVEPADVERRLARRGHREEEGTAYLAIQEGSNHADRLTPVVERGGERLPAIAQLAGDLLHLGARWDEHRHAATLTDRAPDEPL